MSSRLHRVAGVLPALTLALTLTGCGGDQDPPGEPGGATTSATASNAEPEERSLTASTSPTEPSPSEEPEEPTAPPSESTAPTSEPPTTEAAPSVPPGLPPAEADATRGWVAALDELVDHKVSAKRRASHIQGGADLGQYLPELDRQLRGVTLDFAIVRADLDGGNGTGDVAVTSGGRPAGAVAGVSFARVDGTWRLTRPGACQLAQLAGISCS